MTIGGSHRRRVFIGANFDCSVYALFNLLMFCDAVLWQSKHDLKNKDELLVLVRRLPHGVPMGDLKDSYPGIQADVQVPLVDS